MATATHVGVAQAQGTTTTTASFTPGSGELLLVVAAAMTRGAPDPNLVISDSGMTTGGWTALGIQRFVGASYVSSGASRAWVATATGAAGTITITNNAASQVSPVIAAAVYRISSHDGIEAWSVTNADVGPNPVGTGLNVSLWSPAATSLLVSTMIAWESTPITVTPGTGWTELFDGAHIASAAGAGHGSADSGVCLKLQGQTATGINTDTRTVAGNDWWSWRWTVGFKHLAGIAVSGSGAMAFSGSGESSVEPFDQTISGSGSMSFAGSGFAVTDEPITFAQRQVGRGTCYIEVPVLNMAEGTATFPMHDAWNDFATAAELNEYLDANYPRLRWDPVRRIVSGCALGPLPALELNSY